MAENRNELAYYMGRARELAGHDRFAEALEAINAAYREAREDEVSLVDEVKRQIEQQRSLRVRAQTDILAELMARPADQLSAEEERRGEEALALLRAIHSDPTAVQEWEERWRSQRRRAEVQRELRETRQKLEELWQAPFMLLSRYDEARDLAKRKAGEHPDEPAFQELLQQAEQKRDEARRQEGELSTQATTAGFKRLIEEIQRLYDAGERELPWYEWGSIEKDGRRVREPVFQKTVPASSEPIQHLADMAREYEEGKAEEYRQRARSALPADPESAAEWIVPILPPEVEVPAWIRRRKPETEWAAERDRFYYVSSTKRNELAGFYQREIVPLLQRRERPRNLLAEAVRLGQDPEIGWGLIGQAAVEDPYLEEELESARKILRPHLRVQWDRKLQDAEEAWRAGRIEDAQEAAEVVRKHAEGDADPALQELYTRADRLLALCTADLELLSYIEREAQRVAALIAKQPNEAAQALAEMEGRVAGRPLRFQQPLQALRTALQAQLSLEQKIADWERRLRQSDPAERNDDFFKDRSALQVVLDGLDQIRKEIDREGVEARLVPLKKRIEARRHCLLGRADWVAGLYERAKNHWQAAREGDDASLVTAWLGEAEDAVLVTGALETAEAFQKTKQYDKALEVLDPWLPPRPSPRQRDVINLHRQIRKEYANYLVARIEELLRDERPLHRQLVEAVNKLATIDAEKTDRYKVERFPAIYEAWGDQKAERGKREGAITDYDEALKYAIGADHTRIVRKRRELRKRIVFDEVELLANSQKWPEARRALEELLGEYPNDVETLYRLAKIALEQGDARSGEGYIGNAQRRLDEAESGNDPFLAGVKDARAFAPWRLRLRALSVKAQAIKALTQFKEDTESRLQPSHSIREYRLASENRNTLIQRLQDWKNELAQEASSSSTSDVFSQQPAVRREWDEVGRWLQTQAEAEVPKQYALLEGKLIRALEEELAQTTRPDMEMLSFADAPPGQDIRRRWQVGFKILYLSDGRRGTEINQEVLSGLSRLRVTVQDLQGDRRGPDHDRDGHPLEPANALEWQIRWAENVGDWASFLRSLLEDYTWTATAAETSRDEAQTAYDQSERFKKELVELRNKARQVERRLEATVTAGKGARRHWGRVDWRQIVKQILLAQSAARDKSWDDLEDTDPDRRWECWQQAANILSEARLPDRPEQAPWQDINQIIQAADLEERWELILEPLASVRAQFGEHRRVKELIQHRDEAEKRRNQLVLMAAELYAQVQAEEFRAALSVMERMEMLDGEDRYGFRARLTIPDLNMDLNISWDTLRQRLEAQQRQWEEFLEWRAPVETSALKPWRERVRAEVIRLARCAEFKRARELCQDARDGVPPGGKTNRLGGGLALKPLQDYLDNPPGELTTPLSHRLMREKSTVEQWRHDVAEAVRDLDIWHRQDKGVRSMNDEAADKPFPLSVREEAYEACKQELRQCIDAWAQMPETFFWQRRAKRRQHRYCCEILKKLRTLAPDAQEVRDREAELGGCENAQVGG